MRSWTSRIISLILLSLFVYFFVDTSLNVKVGILVIVVLVFMALPSLIQLYQKWQDRKR